MSRDIIDDLHDAEDHIGCLEVGAGDAVTMLQRVLELGERGDRQRVTIDVSSVRTIIDKLAFTSYCRSSCAAGECEDDCGCQAHGDDDHPGWRARRMLTEIDTKFGVHCNNYDEAEPLVLVEYNADTSEHHVSTHEDVDSATKYSAGQEDGWRPLALFNLDSGERWTATVQRVVEFALLDATEVS